MKEGKHSKRKIHLDELSKESGFAMPEGYFEHLESVQMTSNVWTSITKETYFSAPEGYFEQLPQLIQQRIAPKGFFDWSKVIKGIGFSVPQNYFEDLPYRIAERINVRRPSFNWKLVLSLLSPRYLLPLAMGCFMIGYVVIGIFESTDNQVNIISKLGNEDIKEYLLEHQAFGDEQVAERIPTHKVIELESVVPNGVSKEEMEDNMDLSSLDESTI